MKKKVAEKKIDAVDYDEYLEEQLKKENIEMKRSKGNLSGDFEYTVDMIVPKSMTKEHQDKLKVMVSKFVELIRRSESVLFLETNKIKKGD